LKRKYVSAAMRRKVRERAQSRCEYCLLSEEDAFFPHEPDHIVAEKHGGQTTLQNLALACFDCNRFKGADIASIDPASGRLVPLFNPRTQLWKRHFKVEGGKIIPLTAAGRATERVLKLNLQERIEVRDTLTRAGRYTMK
jgi:HNH endonuclease